MLASIVTHFRRGEPRNTRNTRKWPPAAILPAYRWKLHDVCPRAHAPAFSPSAPRRSRIWSAEPCYRFLAYSRMQPPQFARPRSPNSDPRSPTPCVLDVRSSAFRRLPQCHPRQEPRNTRITRKAEQISNRSPQRKQRQKVVGFAHSTQRQQVDWAFRAPRVGSLTDPLACASSSYALARPPYKHAAPASGSGVSVLTSPRRSRLWSAGTCYRFLVYSRPQPPSSRIPDLPTPICDLRYLASLRHTCQESVNPEPPQSAASAEVE